MCPRCRGPLVESRRCVACGVDWPPRDGLPALVDTERVTGNDRLLLRFYDALPRLHDPAVRYTLPLFGTGRESTLREAVLDLLELDRPPRPVDRPLRILEIGVGTGANLPRLRRRIGGPVELWGVDLSAGMLTLCRERLAREGHADTHLLFADAHALPFADASFDRVFHVGATNSYRDPRRALAEMARVSVPGAPIVLADERLDPHRRHSLIHRALFRAVCFYAPYPPDPLELLPPGARDIRDEQPARFFYAVSWRQGATAGAC